jgi:hypothetical protein
MTTNKKLYGKNKTKDDSNNDMEKSLKNKIKVEMILTMIWKKV